MRNIHSIDKLSIEITLYDLINILNKLEFNQLIQIEVGFYLIMLELILIIFSSILIIKEQNFSNNSQIWYVLSKISCLNMIKYNWW